MSRTASSSGSATASPRGLALFVQVEGLNDVGGGSDLAFAAGPGIRRVISGALAPDRAIATGVVKVLRGRGDLLDRFASTFHLAA